MTPPGDLLIAARDILSALSQRGHDACLIGGMVVPRWGEPRTTADVDVSVLAPYGEEGVVIDTILAVFPPRVADAVSFAIASRVLLVETTSRVKIDVALAAFPFELEVLARASNWRAGSRVTVRTCSAEDLIIYKLVAARTRDIGDIEGIVRRQRNRLDIARIRQWGAAFAELKEDPDLLRPFEEVWRQATGDGSP